VAMTAAIAHANATIRTRWRNLCNPRLIVLLLELVSGISR
jgi:hypothetical protein